MGKAKFNAKGRTKRENKRIVGDVRQMQLITTYGVGSIVDFVRDTVIISGIDDWDAGKNADKIDAQKIYNENLQALTGAKYFIEPKVNEGGGWIRSKDIPAFVFPEVLYCPKCKRLVTAKEAANANPKKPNKCCLNRQDGTPCMGTLVASRFVVVCENGHIEDFPYSWWIHGKEGCQSGKIPRFSMYNVGDRSDIDSLFIECEACGKMRGMGGAFAASAFAGENGYPCNGNHPHLKGNKVPGAPCCNKPLKTRLRSATSTYFAVTMSALSIPPWSREAVKIVERAFDDLILMGDNLHTGLAKRVTATVTFDQLLTAYNVVKARKGSASPHSEADIYQDEYRILSQGKSVNDDGDYSSFTADIPIGFEKYFDQITVVDKLTVVETLKGFTRLKPWGGDNEDSDTGKRQLAPLSTYQKEWLPAVQLRGEGIFIQFNEDALSEWKKNVGNRYDKMEQQLSLSYLKSRADRFSAEYVLLHTFAHLLIRQLANECGYSAASLKEKIYSTFIASKDNNGGMHGILIYLASSDCDGSLGGLISIAQSPDKLRMILENMLQEAAWCSGDPLCATSTEQGFNSLNYSACHNCVLLPETSCEFCNVLLDRIAVVGTPEDPQLGYLKNNYEQY